MATLVRKHFTMKITTGSTRRTLLKIVGTLLAILIAGILGSFVAGIVTRPIDGYLTKFAIGIFVGFLVGVTVGIYVKRIWSSFQETLLKENVS
jgi:hypothetical protein